MGTAPRSTTPIFTDASGRRAALVQWTARAFCLGCLVVAVAVAFTLTTHVPLPGLDRILGPQAGGETGRTTDDAAQKAADPAPGSTRLGGVPAKQAGRLVPTASGDPRTGPALDRSPRSAKGGTTRSAVDAGSPVSTGSSSAAPAAPAATPGPTTAPAAPNVPSRGASSGNPRATAKSENSSVRAQPQASRTANPKSEAARTKPKPSAATTGTTR